jgi:hypothetical protein
MNAPRLDSIAVQLADTTLLKRSGNGIDMEKNVMRRSGADRDGSMALTRSTVTQLVVVALLVGSSGVMAASARDYDSVYRDAARDYKRGRYAEAVEKIESIVSRRDSGQVFVVTWNNGSNRPKDWRKAFELLGSMYEEGKGTSRDEDRAWRLYESATGHGMESLWRTDRETGKNVYIGYSSAPQAALGLCRLSTTFGRVQIYCKAFERPENVAALGDPDAAGKAVQKYRDYLNTSDPNLLLVRALLVGDGSLVATALEQGADPNFQAPLSEKDDSVGDSSKRITPLWIAAHSFGSPFVQQLLAAGADPNLVPRGQGSRSLLEDVWGWTQSDPPQKALAFEYFDLLLEHGYTIDADQLRRIRVKSAGSYGMDPRTAKQFERLVAAASPSVRREFEAGEAAQQKLVDQREQELRLRDEQLRLRSEQAAAALLAAKRKIGARLCRQEGLSTVIGYVEALADEKVQIRISESYLTKSPGYQAGDFQQRIIWDYPDNWLLCERR